MQPLGLNTGAQGRVDSTETARLQSIVQPEGLNTGQEERTTAGENLVTTVSVTRATL